MHLRPHWLQLEGRLSTEPFKIGDLLLGFLRSLDFWWGSFSSLLIPSDPRIQQATLRVT